MLNNIKNIYFMLLRFKYKFNDYRKNRKETLENKRKFENTMDKYYVTKNFKSRKKSEYVR